MDQGKTAVSLPKNLGVPTSGMCAGNPIHIGTGNKYLAEVDYQLAGSSSIKHLRFYNSLFDVSGVAAGWNSFPVIDYASVSAVSVRRLSLQANFFTKLNGAFLPDPDIPDRLIELKDAAGVRTGWRYTTADDDVELYDASGKLLSITHRGGRVETLFYSDGTTGSNGGFVLDADGNATSTVLPAGLLIRVSDDAGRSLRFGYDASSRIVKMTDPAGGVFLYRYDAANNLSSVTYPDATPDDLSDNPKKTYLYNEPALTSAADLPHALTGIIDENGNRYASYGYDASGRAISSEHAGGAERVSLNYSVDPNTNNGNGTTIVTDARNTSRTYNFQTILGVVKNTGQSQPGGSGCGPAASNLTYDANGNIATRTDFNGNQTRYSYDLTRNLETSKTEGLTSAGASTPVTRTTQTEWHANFRLPTKITEALGKPEQRITQYSYDSVSGNVLSKTITDSASGKVQSWSYTYTTASDGTLAHLLKSVDGPRSDVPDITSYSYYPNGDLKTQTNALGHMTQYGDYDAHGHVRLVTDPNGLETRLSYTPRGWLQSKTTGLEVTTYDYDKVGQLIRVNLPSGQTIRYSYDAAHRLTDIEDGFGHRMHYTLDLMSNRIKEETFDASNTLVATHRRSFDALNRLWQDIGALNQTTTYEYDANGNLTALIDPLTRTTRHQYDALNRLTQTIDAATKTTQYRYNALDQLIEVSDPRGLMTRYGVNAFNQRSSEQSPDRGVSQASFDPAGNLKTHTDAKNQLTNYQYDALNRVTQASFPGGTISYTYDQGPYAKGRVSQISDPSGLTHYQYNAQGRIAQKTQGSLVLNYTYDPASGNLTSITYPSGRQLQYSYTQGRINSVSFDGQPVLNQITYQPFGPVKSWVFGNGRAYTRSFDADGRLKSYDLKAFVRTLDYDAAGRIQAYLNPGTEQSFGFDDLDRLTSFISNNQTQSYAYDANGNRINLSIGAQNYGYNVSPTSNRLLSSAGPQLKTYQYDANGSLTHDSQFSYTYDGRNRLIQAGTTNYQINALGQRTLKQASFGTIRYLYDETGQLLYEQSSTGAKHYLYLYDIPIGVVQ